MRRLAFAAVTNKATVALRLMKKYARNSTTTRPIIKAKLAIIDGITSAHPVDETRRRDFGGVLSMK
jgi:hypothetical protein